MAQRSNDASFDANHHIYFLQEKQTEDPFRKLAEVVAVEEICAPDATTVVEGQVGVSEVAAVDQGGVVEGGSSFCSITGSDILVTEQQAGSGAPVFIDTWEGVHCRDIRHNLYILIGPLEKPSAGKPLATVGRSFSSYFQHNSKEKVATVVNDGGTYHKHILSQRKTAASRDSEPLRGSNTQGNSNKRVRVSLFVNFFLINHN